MKKIVFILPCKDTIPMGGFKIAYQYADYFAGTGYEVHLVYPIVKSNFLKLNNVSLFLKIKTFIGYYYRLIRKQQVAAQWFSFKNIVHKDFIFILNDFYLKKFRKKSFLFATAVDTAYGLAKAKRIPDKNKFYLIQDFENWRGNTDEYVYNSYKFPFTKIVISKWLQERVERTGNKATRIPNGLDFEYFKLTVPIEKRKQTEIAMLYHIDERKRCCDSMAALEIVKRQIPDLHVTMFGAYDKPVDLPEWYTFYKTPNRETHNSIYNNAAIFVAASEKEGWALPPAEAMQCGAALVCTSVGGFFDYAIEGKTALLSPVYDIAALAENILRLINDNDLRIKIAKAGNEFIQQFTWNQSFAKMTSLIEQA